jgi:hypothetical protein
MVNDAAMEVMIFEKISDGNELPMVRPLIKYKPKHHKTREDQT